MDAKISYETRFTKFLTVAGIILSAQFVVISLIGVIRGYSVPGLFYSAIAMWGGLCLMFADTKRHGMPAELRKKSRNNIRNFFGCGIMIYASCVPAYSNRCEYSNIKSGDDFYGRHQYRQALAEYRKNIDNWFLRLNPDAYDEAQASEKIAQTYGQLGQFDAMIKTYQQIIPRYPGFYADRAKENLQEVHNALALVQTKDQSANPNDFFYVGLAYEYKLHCYAKAIVAYQKVIDSNLPEKTKNLARTQIAVLTK